MSDSMIPRVVSLLPGATDIILTLGAGNTLVGVTHECELPSYVEPLPRITSSTIRSGTAADIDQQVRMAAQQHGALFQLDDVKIDGLHPDLLITQALCDVCAVDENEVRALAKRMQPSPAVLTLNGTTFDGVFDDITRVAAALELESEGEELLAGLRTRLRTVQRRMTKGTPRPKVAVIEWTDPIYAAGHWVPEIVFAAGGIDALAHPGEHSVVRTLAQLRDSHPDVLLFAPCGYNAAHAHAEAQQMLSTAPWAWASNVPAYAIDANTLTSRPGPKIVDAVELLANILHGDAESSRVVMS